MLRIAAYSYTEFRLFHIANLVVGRIYDGQSLAFIAAAVRKPISTVARIGRMIMGVLMVIS